MQSYREQSSYHGNQRLLHQEAQESARLAEYGQHQPSQMFGASAGRPLGEACDQQLYPALRREPTADYYYARSKELAGPQAQRRLVGPLPASYGAQQAGGYSVQYLSEGQWRAPLAAMPGYGQFEPDVYGGQFSPGAGQPQQLRHPPFPAPPGSQQLSQPPLSAVQLAHQSSTALLAKYQQRAAQYSAPQFPAPASTSSSSSSSYPSPQGYGQSAGQAFDGYHMSASTQCDGYMVNAAAAPGYGAQPAYGYQPALAKPCYEQSKAAQAQPHTLHPLQYSKVALLNQQFAPYCSADIPAKSPMPFHQNFSPGSNPSPTTPVAQSPSCSSTPSPLMVTGGDGLQCGPAAMGLGVRSRVLQLLPQPSPAPAGLMPSPGSQAGAYEGFGLEGAEKRASDLGLSSLTALSSQVANIPNTVQHLLISDTLALHRRQARRSSAARPGGPTEHLGLEEQLKSPRAESLDGGCSSSSEDPGERVRQLSGQSGCSERAYKARRLELPGPLGDGRPLSKEELIAQLCQEGNGVALATLAEPRGEKPVGVIVSREAMVGRGDAVGAGRHEDPHSRPAVFPAGGEKATGRSQPPANARGVMAQLTAQNGNGLVHQGQLVLGDPLAARMDPSSKSPSCLAYGFRDLPKTDGGYHYMQYPVAPYNQPEADQFTLGDRKHLPAKTEKSHSLLQEALQASYHGRKFHPGYAPELQYLGFMDAPVQPGYPARQMVELTRKDVRANPVASPSAWGDGRLPEPGFGAEPSKAEPEAQLDGVMSERKSVICDVSPSRPLGRGSVPPDCGHPHDGGFGRGVGSCKAGQSVIQSGLFAAGEARVKDEADLAHGQNRAGGHRDGLGPGAPSPPHWKYEHPELARGPALVTTALPPGPAAGNFPHQALNNRPSRARRPYGRGAGRAGSRRRPPARAEDQVLLARAALVKQETGLELREAGPLRHHHQPPFDKAALYPLPANSDTLSALLTKQLHAPLAGLESEAALRSPIPSHWQVLDPDWTSAPGRREHPGELCRAGVPNEPRVYCAGQQEMGGHLSLQAQSPRSDEWSADADKLVLRKPGDPPGPEDQSVQSPILSRRRIRSFISPIPAKRLCPDSKARDGEVQSVPPHNSNPPQRRASLSPSQKPEFGLDPPPTADEKYSPSGSVSPAASLASPGKTKTLPPRKGRGLKLEAIVQKITSPNSRKFPAPGALDGACDSLTLEDILSVKGGGWECGALAAVQPGDAVRADPLEEARAAGHGGACETARADGSQIGGPPPSALHHPESKPCGAPCSRPGSPGRQAGAGPVGMAHKAEGGSVKGYFPSGKKRGRPLGSINKQKRHRPEGVVVGERPAAATTVTAEVGEEPEETAKRKPKPEGKKPPPHLDRRRKRLVGPAVTPPEPEAPPKHATRAAGRRRGEAQDRAFSPYVLLETKCEATLLCTIINTQDEEQHRAQGGVKGHPGPASAPPPSCVGKALPASSHMVPGPLVMESATLGLLVCCLCGKCANHRDLGDLFGPYYPHQYAGTLPKNPPPKKMMPAQSRVKVRHKSMPELRKTSQSEDEGKEVGSVPGHSRFKRRHNSEDCTPTWASPRTSKGHRRCYCCEKTSSVDFRTQRLKSELGSQVELQLPQLPLDPKELWIHEACVLWASGVYLVSGRLYGLQEAVEMARETKCSHCQEPGATLGCYCKGCPLNYHYICAMEADCFLNEENFSMKCPKHKHRAAKCNSTEQSERG